MGFSALRDRAVGAMRNFFNRKYGAAALLGFADDTPIIRTHLVMFYLTLFFVSTSSALGSYLSCSDCASYRKRIYAACTFCFLLGLFGRTFPLQQQQNEVKRINLLCYGSVFAWACVAPWLAWFLDVDQGFVVSIWLNVGVSFAFFKLAIQQPHTLALACFEALAFSVIITYAVGIGDSAIKIFWFHLCFILYVVAYSKEVVVRVRGGDGDFVAHAVHLYTYFIDFLVNVMKLIRATRRSPLRR